MTISKQAHVEIAVQPPSTAMINRWLAPPIVARTRDPQLLQDYTNGGKHLFATAMLYSSNMEDYTSVLAGNWNVSAQLVMETPASGRNGGGGGSCSGSLSEQWLYFIFDPISVAMEGVFAFNIVVSALSLSPPEKAGMSEVVGGRATRQFSIVSQCSRVEKISRYYFTE